MLEQPARFQLELDWPTHFWTLHTDRQPFHSINRQTANDMLLGGVLKIEDLLKWKPIL